MKLKIAIKPISKYNNTNMDDWNLRNNGGLRKMRERAILILKNATKKELVNIHFEFYHIEIWHLDTINPHPNDVSFMKYEHLLQLDDMCKFQEEHPELEYELGIGKL